MEFNINDVYVNVITGGTWRYNGTKWQPAGAFVVGMTYVPYKEMSEEQKNKYFPDYNA